MPLKPLCVFPVACVFAVQELQCGERAEGPGGGEEDVLSWQSNHLSDQDREHPVDGHRGTWLVPFEHKKNQSFLEYVAQCQPSDW